MARANKNPVPGLQQFEGDDVLASTISVRKAGDGLSEAVSVDPREFHRGDRVFVVLETQVSGVTYKGLAKTEGLQRVHILDTEHAAIVDGETVAEMLAETKQKLAEKREREEEQAGIHKLPGTKVADENGDSDE